MDQFAEAFFADELGDRDASDVGKAGQWNHIVTVTTEQHGIDVHDGKSGFHGNEGLEACHVQTAGLADDAVSREAGGFPCGVHHGVQWIGDEDHNAVWSILFDVFADGLDDFHVGANEVIAAHARLAGDTCGDDDNVRTFDFGEIVGGNDVAVEQFHGAGLSQVKHAAIDGQHFVTLKVNCDDIAQFLVGSPESDGGTDVATSTDDRDFCAFWHFESSFNRELGGY